MTTNLAKAQAEFAAHMKQLDRFPTEVLLAMLHSTDQRIEAAVAAGEDLEPFERVSYAISEHVEARHPEIGDDLDKWAMSGDGSSYAKAMVDVVLARGIISVRRYRAAVATMNATIERKKS